MMVEGIFDGGNGADDALIVGHLLLRVKWDVEIHLIRAVREMSVPIIVFVVLSPLSGSRRWWNVLV